MKKFIANPEKVPGSLLIGRGRMVNRNTPVPLDEDDPQVAGAIAKGLLIPYKKNARVKAVKTPDVKITKETEEDSKENLTTPLPEKLKTESDANAEAEVEATPESDMSEAGESTDSEESEEFPGFPEGIEGMTVPVFIQHARESGHIREWVEYEKSHANRVGVLKELNPTEE
jgi:hypothetical protein